MAKKKKKIRLFECIALPDSNKHLLEPFYIGEKVIYAGKTKNKKQPDSFNAQFMYLKRIRTKTIMNESRKFFKEIGKK